MSCLSSIQLTTRAIGVERFGASKPDVKWAGLFGAGGENKKYGFEPEVSSSSEACVDTKISLHQVSAHRNDELTAIHHPSGTLLEADLMFNLPAKEQYSRAGGIPSWFSLMAGSLSPGGMVHSRLISGVFGNKQECVITG